MKSSRRSIAAWYASIASKSSSMSSQSILVTSTSLPLMVTMVACSRSPRTRAQGTCPAAGRAPARRRDGDGSAGSHVGRDVRHPYARGREQLAWAKAGLVAHLAAGLDVVAEVEEGALRAAREVDLAQR